MSDKSRRDGAGCACPAGPAAADRPSDSAVSLGLALRARTEEVAELVLARWEAGQGGAARSPSGSARTCCASAAAALPR